MDLSRRRLLRTSAVGAAGLAGCTSRRRIPEPDNRGIETAGTTATDGDASRPAEPSDATEHPLPRPRDHCSRDVSVASDDPLAVEFDARERFKCLGAPLDNFESLDAWEAHTGSLAADEEHVYSGTQSARVEATASDQRARIHRRFPGGVDLSGYDLSLALKLEDPVAQGVTVHVAAPDNANALLMGRYVRKAGWIRLDLGPYHARGDPDLSNVTRISVQVYTGGGTPVRYYVDSLRRHPRSDTGRLVLTFNNSQQSHYETVFQLTERYGVKGVVSVIPGSARWDNKISLPRLREMRDAGWDVVASPRPSGGFRNLEPGQEAALFRESKQWLVDNGFERGADVLAWPSGAYDRSSLQVASRYYHLGLAGGRGPPGSLTEPLLVGRIGGGNLERVKRFIDLAARYNKTLPLTYNAVGNMRDGISSKVFERALTYAQDRGLEVVTATDLLEDLEERTERTPTSTPEG